MINKLRSIIFKSDHKQMARHMKKLAKIARSKRMHVLAGTLDELSSEILAGE